MSADKIVFFGGDGGCLDAFFLAQETADSKAVIEAIILSDSSQKMPSNAVYGGGFASIENGRYAGYHFVYQCGSVQNHRTRHTWFEKAVANEMLPLSCVSKAAYVHKTAVLGSGVIVYPGVRIMRDVVIGDNVVLLPNSVINHGCEIGDYSIVNSSVTFNGDVRCGRNCFFGAATTVRENVTFGDGVTIGMGSLILNSILTEGVYFGRPKKRKLPDNRI